MSPQRIVSADEARALARAGGTSRICTSWATFPDGRQDCGLPASHVGRGEMHENAAHDHRWSLDSQRDGEPVFKMVKP